MYKYAESDWIVKNKIEEGTLVRVTREAVDYEDGWENTWVYGMGKYVGREFEVDSMDEGKSNYIPGYGIPLRDDDDDVVFTFQFPYFVLEVV